MKHNQLTFAREYRGITQTELSKMVDGLSQPNLSKFEKGINTLSDDLLHKIMDVLSFPYEFLNVTMEHEFDRNFRKKASLKSTEKGKIERFVESVAYCVDCMCEDLEVPDFRFPCIDVESGVEPEEIALQVRRMFRLGVSPILNLCNFMERNGVMIYEWDCPYEGFDGISLNTTKGNRIVIINRNRSNDRKIYSLAHELGHTLMHNNIDFFIVSSRDKEDEANRFASEFLMPELGIRSSLINLRFSDLPSLKRYWRSSMSSIIVRARKLNQINDTKYKSHMIELSRRGWRISEPYEVDLDNPVVIDKMFSAMRNGLGYDLDTLSEYMCLPRDILQTIFLNRSKVVYMRT